VNEVQGCPYAPRTRRAAPRLAGGPAAQSAHHPAGLLGAARGRPGRNAMREAAESFSLLIGSAQSMLGMTVVAAKLPVYVAAGSRIAPAARFFQPVTSETSGAPGPAVLHSPEPTVNTARPTWNTNLGRRSRRFLQTVGFGRSRHRSSRMIAVGSAPVQHRVRKRRERTRNNRHNAEVPHHPDRPLRDLRDRRRGAQAARSSLTCETADQDTTSGAGGP
jgi:hypothetical protein